jgi:hypothetical protein
METRRGIGLGEVVVVLVIVVVVGLMLLAALPRRREAARLAACRRNLAEIGVAMALYDGSQRRLPTVPPLGPEDPPAMSGPLAVMLQALGLPSFAGLTDPRKPPAARPGGPAGPIRIRGFVCPTDRSGAVDFPAPVSYRGTTGGTADGAGGVFAPGRPPLRLADVDAADGLGYTVAFAERLLGTGQDFPLPANYAVVPGLVGSGACPEPASGSWRGDAGSSWAVAGWGSTLYNHALTPNGRPSCLADDSRTARMGASSGHIEGVNVLKCDLAVVTCTDRVDATVWRALADLEDAR